MRKIYIYIYLWGVAGKNMSTPGPKATISGHVFKLVGGGVDMFFDLFFDMFFDPTGTWGIFEDI